MTPPWVIAIAIATQLAFTHVVQSPSPSCTLKFENLHYSTSVNRNMGKDAIKMNVKTVCNSAQIFSELTAQITQIKNGQTTLAYESTLTRVPANRNNNTEADFLDFWFPCKKGEVLLLQGIASGKVHLANSNLIPVSGFTGKYTPIRCDFPAR